MIRVAINGFGRIGRNFLRAVLQDASTRELYTVVAINIGPSDPEMVAHLFMYDTLMGTYPGSVAYKNNQLIIDDYPPIDIIAVTDPSLCNWADRAVDWVIESSGKYTHRTDALKHCDAGAVHVLISAPAQQEDIAIIPGINEDQFDAKKHKIVSLGSCTTNAFLPLVYILHNAFTINKGHMTTIHAYTNSQVLLDVEGEDARRSRAAALNIIPTTTGVMRMIEKMIPGLQDKIKAVAIRVPVAKVSLIDFTFEAGKTVSVDAMHEVIYAAMQKNMHGIIDITMKPLVSSDFGGSPYSVVVDGLLTSAQGTMGTLFGWYDNEWGYSMRLKDFLIYVSRKK
jgi:glyceraldehyde 3-phosphate dehydrogenase